MNNAYAMSASFEARKNTQATMITAGFAALLLLLMFFWTWTIPVIIPPPPDEGVLVELNLPEEPPIEIPKAGGGGGGGNPVQAIGERGTASAPPQPGTQDDAKDIVEDETEKTSPPILRPDNPKPTATKINENKSVAKVEPKPDPPPPAPPTPKAVVPKGKTLTGNKTGGGTAEDYDRSGGNSGNSYGVGNKNGTNGGSNGGNGGGNNGGDGTGTGPRKISGNRIVINPKPMNAGENIQGKILAEIRVSPDGVGTFVRGKGGSLMNNSEAVSIVRDWLRRNKFNATGDESLVVYEFNIKLGG